MSLPKTVVIEGKTYRWRDILRMRREQAKPGPQPKQQQLFELKEDTRTSTQTTAAGRYQEPTLFKVD